MANQPLHSALVDGLVEARGSGTLWRPERLDESLGLADAYRVQDAVAARMGWFTTGQPMAWKAGGKPVMTGAPLPRVLDSGAPWHDMRPRELIAEAEIALRLGRTPSSEADVADCLSAMCVSIEIVGTRLAGGLAAPPAWKVADQGVHDVLVAGAELPYQPRDWARQVAHIRVNGIARATATGTHPNGDVLAPLPWLFGHARERGMALKAGDLVTTGAWLITPVQPGDVIEVSFDGIGAARLG